MAKKTRREELLSMFDEDRRVKRCVVVTHLREQGKKLTVMLDSEIERIQKAIDERRRKADALRSEMNSLDIEIDVINRTKHAILSDHLLKSFTVDTCGVSTLHPDLIAFDTATQLQRKDLLMKKLPR